MDGKAPERHDVAYIPGRKRLLSITWINHSYNHWVVKKSNSPGIISSEKGTDSIRGS
jgi:hypothetical protein